MGVLGADIMTGALLTPTETTVLWGLHHPYWLVAIAVGLIIFLQISLSLLGQLLRHMIQWLGRSPLSLGRWLLTQKNTGEKHQEHQPVETILQRLNSLQEEQAMLLAELKQKLPNQK